MAEKLFPLIFFIHYEETALHLKDLNGSVFKWWFSFARVLRFDSCFLIPINGCVDVWQRTLNKIRTLKKNSKCVKFWTKSTQFEFLQSALFLGQTRRTLKNIFKCIRRVCHFYLWCRYKHEVNLLALFI